MALSDSEKEIFENLVGGLYDKDTSTMSENVDARKVIVFVIVLILGVALLIVGVITKLIIVGVIGFALMMYPVYRAGLKSFKTW